MLFTDMLKMSSKLTVGNIQKAFCFTVEKLRLDPCLLAVRLIGRKNFSGWQNPFLNEIESEFQIRNITEVMNGTLTTTPIYKTLSTTNECMVCDVQQPLTNWGLTNPIDADVSFTGDKYAILESTIECTTSDKAMMFLNCYMYPYFVRNIDDSNPFTTKHTYDIQEMIDTYGADHLEVDLTMMMPVLLIALSYYEDDVMNIGSSQNLSHIAIRMINIYNSNMQSLGLEGDGGDVASIAPYILGNGGTSYGVI